MSEPVINSEMAPMEQLIRTVVNAAKNGGITAHNKTEEAESWIIATENAKYKVEKVNRMAKTQRKFDKTNFYEIKEDGTTKVVNLGQWKKKLFYTLLYNLTNDKVFHKIDADPAKIREIANAIKTNPSCWTMDAESIKGMIDGKTIEVKRDRIEYPSGKSLYRVKLFEDGVQTLKGSQLMKLWK